MADIFVSYKREDQEQKGRVLPIVKALEAEGFDVFYDVEIPPGSTWEQVLQGKINASKCVVVLWSEASVDSDWVKEEAEIAKNAGKIIPVFLDPVAAPFGFGRIEGANLFDWTGDLNNVEWKNLVNAVKAKVGEGKGIAQPEVTRVSMPVDPTTSKPSGGGAMKALFAIIILALIGGGGYFGYQMLQKQGSAPSGSTTTATLDHDKLAFEKAKAEDSISGYQAFLTSFPTSGYAKDAKERSAQLRELLRRENMALADAKAQGTVEAFETFLTKYPNSKNADNLKARIAALKEQSANACRDALQGKIAVDAQGRTEWSDANLANVCTGNETSVQPAKCFDTIMKGNVSWGGGTVWQPANAMNLCKGSTDASATITCFSSFIRAGQSWSVASQACQSNPNATPPKVSATTLDTDCLSYSGDYDIRVSSNGQLAQLIDTTRNSTPLAARGADAKSEIERALFILNKYGLTKQCFVDRPNPPLSYWKTSSGDIPKGDLPGEDCVGLDRFALNIKLLGGMYHVYEGSLPLLRFDNEASAKQAIDILKANDATDVCYIGRPGPSMTYIRGDF